MPLPPENLSGPAPLWCFFPSRGPSLPPGPNIFCLCIRMTGAHTYKTFTFLNISICSLISGAVAVPGPAGTGMCLFLKCCRSVIANRTVTVNENCHSGLLFDHSCYVEAAAASIWATGNFFLTALGHHHSLTGQGYKLFYYLLNLMIVGELSLLISVD